MDEVKQKVCCFKALYQAMYKCRRNVMWKDSVAGYVKNGLVNCLKLSNQLYDDTYAIDKYNIFTIHEPKVREIVSTRIKDRVFQRSLCDNYLYKAVTKSFIYDNCACQLGKGTDFAVNRLMTHMQRFYRQHGISGYVLKCDIKNYFGSTPHSVAKQAIAKRIDSLWAYDQVADIINSFNNGPNPNIGLGLGSHISQLAQLAVLDDLDHEIKEQYRIKYYVRYMDDFILVHDDIEYLKLCKTKIEAHLNKLSLKLSSNKTKIFPLSQGIKFLGFRLRLTATGGIVKTINSKNISHERRKLCKQKILVDKNIMSKVQVDSCFISWKAHAQKGNTHNLILQMDKFYENLWRTKDVQVHNNKTTVNRRKTEK